MLQHVVEAQVLDLILGRVDLLIRILKLRLDHESRWVTESTGGGVVGTGVAALGFHVGDITILRALLAINSPEQVGANIRW